MEKETEKELGDLESGNVPAQGEQGADGVDEAEGAKKLEVKHEEDLGGGGDVAQDQA